MERIIDTQAYLDTVLELLRGGSANVPVTVTGSSMTPFLRQGDTVYLNLLTRPPRPGDIVLYTRPEGRYILHRVVAVNRDGSFTMLGDAQTRQERIGSREQIHAIATGARRRGRNITPRSFVWWFYGVIWRWVAPWRPTLIRFRERLRRKNSP